MNNNIRELLNSKRFWSFIVGAGVMGIVNIVPSLADNADQLNAILLIVVSALIGGYTVTDSFEAKYKK